MQRFLIVLVVGMFSDFAMAQSPAPVLAESLRWSSPPSAPGLQAAWVLGAEGDPKPYVLRVKLAAGTAIAPHTHPDQRHTTVLAGTLYVGFGESFDETKTVAIPAGAVYVTPANTAHYVWAKDGESIYQESGIGPTGTTLIKR